VTRQAARRTPPGVGAILRHARETTGDAPVGAAARCGTLRRDRRSSAGDAAFERPPRDCGGMRPPVRAPAMPRYACSR